MDTFFQTTDHNTVLAIYMMAPIFIMYMLSTLSDLYDDGRRLAHVYLREAKQACRSRKMVQVAQVPHSRIKRHDSAPGKIANMT